MDIEASGMCKLQMKRCIHMGMHLARITLPIVSKIFLLERSLIARFSGANVGCPRTEED